MVTLSLTWSLWLLMKIVMIRTMIMKTKMDFGQSCDYNLLVVKLQMFLLINGSTRVYEVGMWLLTSAFLADDHSSLLVFHRKVRRATILLTNLCTTTVSWSVIANYAVMYALFIG